MTKEQFEAHVKAAAAKKHVLTAALSDIKYAKRMGRREAYIAARMEHEWPLVEAGNAMATAYGESWEADRDSEDESQAFERLNSAWRKWVEILAPYTTKHIEP